MTASASYYADAIFSLYRCDINGCRDVCASLYVCTRERERLFRASLNCAASAYVCTILTHCMNNTREK